MAFLLPTMGPTAHPTHNNYFLPVSQAEAANTINAPLVGFARTANANFQPAVVLPQSLPNMAPGYNPRVIRTPK
jgi:hypothetical protein